jgi:hypothetical protein
MGVFHAVDKNAVLTLRLSLRHKGIQKRVFIYVFLLRVHAQLDYKPRRLFITQINFLCFLLSLDSGRRIGVPHHIIA